MSKEPSPARGRDAGEAGLGPGLAAGATGGELAAHPLAELFPGWRGTPKRPRNRAPGRGGRAERDGECRASRSRMDR